MSTTARLFKGTFKALFANFDAIVKLTWAWTALTIGLSIFAVTQFQNQDVGGTGKAALGLLLLAVRMMAGASIAVGWHRCLLAGEKPSPIYLKVGRREVVYLGKSFLLTMAMLAVFGGAAFLHRMFIGYSQMGRIAGLVLLVAMIFWVLPVFLRLSLILPAGALDEPLGLSAAWRWSGGLGYPLFFVACGVGAVIGIAGIALDAVFAAVPAEGILGVLFYIKVVLLSVLKQILTLALTIGILTGGYYVMRERATQNFQG